ncbi:MAG: DNA mismatch repair protein MutS [Desulfonatronospira sp. MSAO_Bac3]|nr:MAG: DNA mismatch repair protein MutS [Desulfonatronospira sp. MSAO_Bac3]
MLEQYMQIKQDYPDCLLFFRMGDFYELFFEDAETAARELQITLTARNPNAELKVPMCGVPYHACEEYLRQLLEKGHKVAVCDQVEDPGAAKGLVKREVTRVLTPGTVVEDSSLEARENNYLGALFWDTSRGRGGLAWAEFSTGEWTGLELKNEDELWQWLQKINPSEILVAQGYEPPRAHVGLQPRINFVPAGSYFEPRSAREMILRSQQAVSLQVLDLEDKPCLVRACGAILMYMVQTHKKELTHLASFKPMNLTRYLYLDEVTIRNLELFRTLGGQKGPGTLLHVLDRTLTPMGARYLQTRLRQPWKEPGPINDNQQTVDCLYKDNNLRELLRLELDQAYDLERLNTRIALNRCNPKDLAALLRSLQILPGIKKALQGMQDKPGLVNKTLENWDDMQDLCFTLEKALVENPPHLITEGGIFRSGYDSRLDELIELTDHGESKLKELLEKERTQNDLPKLKLGYNRVFGYYFELSRAVKDSVPEHFQRRQTLASSERYLTPELKDLENSMLSAAEQRKSREMDLFGELRQFVAGHGSRMKKMSACLARIDYWQGLASAAREWNWSRPVLSKDIGMQIKKGRHPAIEAIQGRSGYVPNDMYLEDPTRILLITGPNMAGKSTVLRQTAIIAILAQMGSFVPAREASIGLCDRIFSRVGASDNLAQGQSTFMVEMTETARILRQATRRSLVILDEIGRGTSTYDGLALAWAVVEELARKHEGIRTLFATHYHELTKLEQEFSVLKNYNIAVKEWKKEIVFLRRLVPGPADKSYGIEVARLAGVPDRVVDRARNILEDLERQKERKSVVREQRKTMFEQGMSMGPAQKVKEDVQSGQYTGDNDDKHGVKKGEEHPVVSRLAGLDINSMTPLEALNLLAELKKEAG